MSLLVNVYVLTFTDTKNSILCSDYAIKRIDEPFVKADDNLSDWAI